MLFSEVRAIFLDAVGTLIHPHPPAPVVYEQMGKRFGSHYNAAVIRSRFAEAFAQEEQVDRRRGWRTSEEREIERWRHIVSNVLDDVIDQSACFQSLFDHFSTPDAWSCDPAAGNILNLLSKHGFVLGLASNYDSRLRPVVAGKPGLTAIQNLCISSEIGWRKPAPEFFAGVCQSVGIPAEQILFVGDDPINDFEGAVNAGLRAVLFEPDGRDETGKIRRLSELLTLVIP